MWKVTTCPDLTVQNESSTIPIQLLKHKRYNNTSKITTYKLTNTEKLLITEKITVVEQENHSTRHITFDNSNKISSQYHYKILT